MPVVAQREEIARAVSDHPVVIVCGETGSGKTTQLPKILLELNRGVAGMIGHTQPRRIEELQVSLYAQELKTPYPVSLSGSTSCGRRYGRNCPCYSAVRGGRG